MAYKSKRKLYPVAVSIAEAASVLGVTRTTIELSLKAGHLVARIPEYGTRRPRILVDDLVSYVRTYWRAVACLIVK
jgi:hypothetical protein